MQTPNDFKISVEENLRRIITKRKFTHANRPFLGLNDIIDSRATHEQKLLTLDVLSEQITLCEPRIKLTSIAFCGSDTIRIEAINQEGSVSEFSIQTK